jgi:hypothetical protein
LRRVVGWRIFDANGGVFHWYRGSHMHTSRRDRILLCLALSLGIGGAPSSAAPSSSNAPPPRFVKDVPLATARHGDGYVRGLETLLAHAGNRVDYTRLMGLSGVAFITQADTEHRWKGKVDVGWWPLDPWGFRMRLNFVGRAVGHTIQETGWPDVSPDEFCALGKRLPEVYRERVLPSIKEAIDAGQPLLATCEFGYVVTGYDDSSDKPPVLGRWACETNDKTDRCRSWPVRLIVLGSRCEPMTREAADLAALQYAVRLMRDEAGPFEPEWRATPENGCNSHVSQT